MDEMEKAAEYVRAQQKVEIANRALEAARPGPLLKIFFPGEVKRREEASWPVADDREATKERAAVLGQQLPPETKRIADEVLEEWKKGK